MVIGVYALELHLPSSRSLKDRRQVLRRLKDGFRARHNVAVSEFEELGDLRQRAGLWIVSVATHRDPLERLFASILREAEQQVPGHVIESCKEFLESSDAGPRDWGGDR